jgi:hypothetical protein
MDDGLLLTITKCWGWKVSMARGMAWQILLKHPECVCLWSIGRQAAARPSDNACLCLKLIGVWYDEKAQTSPDGKKPRE